MVDLHTHILPGVDDGARTMSDSIAMARAALADGVEVVVATPHVREDYPTSVETMERLVSDLRHALGEAGIHLDVRPGAEVALDRLDALTADEVRRLSLSGAGRYLLLEFPYHGWPLEIDRTLRELRTLGMSAVLAHPERSPEVQSAPGRLASLVAEGALVQLTAASLDGRLGRRARRTSLTLLELELAHVVASDAHAPNVRAIGLSGVGTAIRDPVLAGWLTRDAPAAIAAGAPLPTRASSGRRSRTRLTLRRRFG